MDCNVNNEVLEFDLAIDEDRRIIIFSFRIWYLNLAGVRSSGVDLTCSLVSAFSTPYVSYCSAKKMGETQNR